MIIGTYHYRYYRLTLFYISSSHIILSLSLSPLCVSSILGLIFYSPSCLEYISHSFSAVWLLWQKTCFFFFFFLAFSFGFNILYPQHKETIIVRQAREDTERPHGLLKLISPGKDIHSSLPARIYETRRDRDKWKRFSPRDNTIASKYDVQRILMIERSLIHH